MCYQKKPNTSLHQAAELAGQAMTMAANCMWNSDKAITQEDVVAAQYLAELFRLYHVRMAYIAECLSERSRDA